MYVASRQQSRRWGVILMAARNGKYGVVGLSDNAALVELFRFILVRCGDCSLRLVAVTTIRLTARHRLHKRSAAQFPLGGR
jgi:hypothetical protein